MGNPNFTEDSLRQAMQLAQSPAGRQLLQLLQASGGDELRVAMELAAAGDYTQAKKTVSTLMQDPKAKKLLAEIGGKP